MSCQSTALVFLWCHKNIHEFWSYNEFMIGRQNLGSLILGNTTSTMFDSRSGVLGVKGLTFSPPSILLFIVAQELQFCFMWPQRLPSRRFFSLSTWSAANFSPALRWPGSTPTVWSQGFFLPQQPLSSCCCKTHLTVDTDTCLPAASNSLQTLFVAVFGWHLTILTSFLSEAGDTVHFYFTINSQQLLSVRITQKKLRGHATRIHTTFYRLPSHLNWLWKLVYIFDPADWVTFSINSLLNQTSWMFCCCCVTQQYVFHTVEIIETQDCHDIQVYLKKM